MLDFRIQTFLCVCKHMNFTKAAEELHLTQPCVSQHIHYLEKYYQAKLFAYDNKSLRITDAGKRLYSAMLSFRHDEIYLKKILQSSASPIETVKFGATLSIGEYYLPDKLVEFLRKNRHVQVNLTISDTARLLNQLDNGSIDFALIEGYFQKSSYDFLPIQKEEMIAVRGKEYPVQPVRDISDLFSCHLITREAGSGTRNVLENYLKGRGYSLSQFSMVSTVNNIAVILKLLTQNQGISFLYRSVVEKSLREGSLLPISIPDCEIFHEFNFIWRKNSLFSVRYHSFFDQIIRGSTSG